MSSPSTTVRASRVGASGRFNRKEMFPTVDATPGRHPQGDPGQTIRAAVTQSDLGLVLVAATERGLCAIQLGDDAEELVEQLRDRFQSARVVLDRRGLGDWVTRVVAFLEAPSAGLALPLDVQGTTFQKRVWEALRSIPPGRTRSYAWVAAKIGRPTAARAVAQACAANPLAVAIPCHRVVRSDGALSGYRWGVQRKRTLLRHESQSAGAHGK